MNQPRQFRLTTEDVVAIQRNGTLRRDLVIADWMQRCRPYGEYRAGAGSFVVISPTGELSAGPDDWIIRCANRFLPCPAPVFSVFTNTTDVGEVPEPSMCSECCDPVPPADLHPIPSGAKLCADCLLEYQVLLEAPDPSVELDRSSFCRSEDLGALS